MVAFSSEHPGKFGLDSIEVRLVEHGLEYLLLGPFSSPTGDDERDLEAAIDYSARFQELMGQSDPVDPYLIACKTVRAENAKLWDSHGVATAKPLWLPDSIVASVIDALPVGVQIVDDFANQPGFEHFATYQKAFMGSIANDTIEQLLPVWRSTALPQQ